MLATRAVSGHSVPIITFMAAGGAGFILRGYGPEYMGGPAVGREVDAEVAGPELSTDEIDPVSISCQASKRTR